MRSRVGFAESTIHNGTGRLELPLFVKRERYHGFGHAEVVMRSTWKTFLPVSFLGVVESPPMYLTENFNLTSGCAAIMSDTGTDCDFQTNTFFLLLSFLS